MRNSTQSLKVTRDRPLPSGEERDPIFLSTKVYQKLLVIFCRHWPFPTVTIFRMSQTPKNVFKIKSFLKK
jgi:hypothetical protein